MTINIPGTKPIRINTFDKSKIETKPMMDHIQIISNKNYTERIDAMDTTTYTVQEQVAKKADEKTQLEAKGNRKAMGLGEEKAETVPMDYTSQIEDGVRVFYKKPKDKGEDAWVRMKDGEMTPELYKSYFGTEMPVEP